MNLYQTAVYLIGLAYGLFHRWHVSTLFENDRHFSHLSEMEREMSFRTEMGMYYSYYKRIANSKSFLEGLDKITHDNISEYGNVIDAAKKYNLFPELVAGYLYHIAKNIGIFSKKDCWQVDKGDGMQPIFTCEGLGVPVYFYLEIVWMCTIVTAAVLFYYATYVGDSVYSGFVAILFFFYNHNECTRVQWTPPLRESFAYPALLYQMYILTVILREYTSQEVQENSFYRKRNLFLKMGTATAISLWCWQFSHLVFTTQVIALLILRWMKIIPKYLYDNIVPLHSIPILVTMIVMDSRTLMNSLYLSIILISQTTFILMEKHFTFLDGQLQTGLEIILTITFTTCLKCLCGYMVEDDAHIFNLLRSKLTSYKDFHTMLYTCSPEFDFLPYRSYEAIVETLLLPTAVLAGILILYFWYRSYKIKGYPNCVEVDMAYNGLQTAAFVVMAVFIMRLKLFMNPHLCIIAGTVCAKRYLEKLGLKSDLTISGITFLLISAMSYHGLERLQEERSIMGEYSNIEQEDLFEWIKAETPKDAVFAGKMSLMANLMLSTGRPIVNNPYYESKEMRDRTMKVYEIFSRKSVISAYFALKELRVAYVILEEPHCFGFASLPEGCQMLDLWDLVDQGAAKEAGEQPLCPILYQDNAFPFVRVFTNNRYVVLQLGYLQHVELKPKTSLHYQF